MTTDTTGMPRANMQGDPCPQWCTQDHSRPVIPGKLQHGTSDCHWSSLELHDHTLMARLSQYPGLDTEPKICLTTIYGQEPLFFTAAEALRMARLLEFSGIKNTVAALLRAAAAAAAGEST